MPAPSHTDSPNADTCSLCGRPAVDPLEEDGTVFCSSGCRAVDATLGAGGTRDSSGGDVAGDGISGDRTSRDETATTERVFFHVAGMHSPTCEAFLETTARAQEGVTAAEASYVTESIRVEYDPDRISEDVLGETLTTVGYRVLSREETTGESVATVQSRDSSSTRALEDLLGFRYAAGVVFGTFMLLPYIAVLYPAHVSELLGGPADLFEGSVVESGAILLLPLFVGVTGVIVFFTGLPLLRGAYVSLRMRRPNTDLLATLTVLGAFTYSTLALLLGRTDIYFDLVIVVAAGVVAATFYESLVKQRAMGQLTDLTISQTDVARVCLPDDTVTVDVSDLHSGDRVLVREGERIPVDGVLVAGRCTVDESVVTGESLPVEKEAGDDLLGGAVVTDAAAVIRVGDPPTSSIDRLRTSVWLLQSATHGLQRRADRIAARVVPVLIGVAMLSGLTSLVLGRGLVASVLVALAVVVVACPWGLALSTPLSVATNLRAALDRGIVVFDETVFERLRETDVVVLDKTGTLTTGEMHVVDADAPSELLAATATLERHASHPVAEAIVSAFADERVRPDDPAETDGGTDRTDDPGVAAGDTDSDRPVDADPEQAVTAFESHARGVSGRVDGIEYLVGHPGLFEERGWAVGDTLDRRVREARETGRLPVLVGRAGRAEGVVVLADESREGWDDLVAHLAGAGIEVVVLTGDDPTAVGRFADHPGVAHAFAGIPPEGKTEAVRRLQANAHVTMAGDGTNDAPALAAADLGIALGSGTALASDAADIALVGDDLHTIETTFDLARAAGRRVRQNTALALGYNALVIPVALAGFLNPLVAMGAVVVTGGLLAANAFRPLLDG